MLRDENYLRIISKLLIILLGGHNAPLYVQEETTNFLNEDFISLDDDFNVNHVGPANRKRIAMAVETLQSFTSDEKATIFDYIKDYCRDLSFDEGDRTFAINDEDGLKHLLWGIEQRYYTTRVGDEKRIANSVSSL